MNTNRSVRRRLPCFFTSAIFAALAFSVAGGQGPEKMALNKPEKIIGNWQSVGADDAVTASLTEKGEFEFGGTEDGKRVVQMKGTYTVDAASWPLKLTFVSGEKKSYGAIAVVSNDGIMLEKLGSLEEKPAMNDDSALTRRASASRPRSTLSTNRRSWSESGNRLAIRSRWKARR